MPYAIKYERGSYWQRRGIEDFADHVADCDLVDLPLYGASFPFSLSLGLSFSPFRLA